MITIPNTVAKVLPPEGSEYYSKIFVNSYSRHKNEAFAHRVAWEMTKSCMRNENGILVANAEDFITPQLFRFSLSPAEGEMVIKNADNGEIEIDAVLATTEPRRTDGMSFDEQGLQELADQINAEGSTFPDVDHATLTRLQEMYGPDVDAIAAAVKREKGVFRTIKAAVKDGKLWIKAFLDKRYKNYTERFKKLSIEALAKPTHGGKLVSPRYLGFTFTNTPQLAGAGIAA